LLPVTIKKIVSTSSCQCCRSGMFIPDPNFFHPVSASNV
jgi:hypothetical protein